MAKTYGQTSKDALAERQANDDPLKWRKFVSYAEFTPPKTPVEGHFIPGYSGNVAGVYAENLYAKTYGKCTLQAVNGDFPKGCEYDTSEQARSAQSPTCGPSARGTAASRAPDAQRPGLRRRHRRRHEHLCLAATAAVPRLSGVCASRRSTSRATS